jgi:hypothetical protein
MIRLSLCLAVLLAPGVLPASASAQDMPVPSGVPIRFVEVLLEPETGFARFRFLAPNLGTAGAERDVVSGDFAWLCERIALPALQDAGWSPQQIVISIADRDVPFGQTDPDAIQYFDGFSVSGDTCQWEPF